MSRLAAALALARGFDDTSKSLSSSMMSSSWEAAAAAAVRGPRVDINVSSFSVSLSHTLTTA